MSGTALIIDNISKEYGQFKAVDSVSLSVNPGESLALLGHNGAGKTTLFKLALGLIQPTSGESILACDKRNIGYLPENIAFYDQMSAEETLFYYASLKKASYTQANDLLELVGLAPFKKRRIRTYSKGMRQRLGFAQALLGKPEILFLDEPTAGLDPIGREDLFGIIKQLNNEGSAVIFSSHVLRELENKVGNIAIMHSGRLIAHDTLESLRIEADIPAHILLRTNNAQQQKSWAEYLLSFTEKTLDISKQGENILLISCPLKMKKPLILFIMEAKLSFEDLDIVPPSLADIYIKMCQEYTSEENKQKMAA